MLVRFAGPRLAAGDDDLVPVKLRRGGRILGGSLSWDQPQPLAAFSRESPFFGMAVPTDVTGDAARCWPSPTRRLTERTWATLADGTPLVTAQRRGKGLIVLFHVTADTRWSDLPLSGRSSTCSSASSSRRLAAPPTTDATRRAAREVVPPTRVLDGFGAFGPPPADGPAGAGGFAGAPPPIIRPASTDRRRACWRSTRWRPPTGWRRSIDLAAQRRREAYRMASREDLRGPIFCSPRWRCWRSTRWSCSARRRHSPACAPASRRRRRAGARHGLLAAPPPLGPAQTAAQRAPARRRRRRCARRLETRLAYVVTGDAEVDRISKAGLQGLTLFLAQRTALEAGEPVGVDPARDELAFYPLIYWPIVPSAPQPRREALTRIDAYMKQGGTVLFDTRDAVEAPPGRAASHAARA